MIGLEFSADAVSALLDEGDARTDVEPAFAALGRKQLIYGPTVAVADDFRFSHILVRDIAHARLETGWYKRWAARRRRQRFTPSIRKAGLRRPVTVW